MDTLLDALQEGRLIELPDNNKDDALQFLAHIIEAIPSLPTGIDVVGLVMAKERSRTLSPSSNGTRTWGLAQPLPSAEGPSKQTRDTGFFYSRFTIHEKVALSNR
jgi:hypothetical protein